MIACAALFLGITGCTKEQEAALAGKKTTMNLNLSFSNGTTGTRSDDPDNAIASEVAVNTIDVFIFDKTTKTLVNNTRLTSADFEPATGANAYKNKATAKIETTIGEKLVAVGINLPADFPNATSVATFKQAWTTTLANLTSASDGFVMFSQDFAAADLVPATDQNYDTKNTINTSVERVVAKVAVQDGGIILDQTSGKLSDIQFAIRNSNKKLFPVQVVENTVVKDPNWDSYTPSDFADFTDYADINLKSEPDHKAWNVRYTTENTSKEPNEKNSTYACVKVTLVPKFFSDAAGVLSEYTGGAVDFWVVKTTDGDVRYFQAEADANTFATATQGSTISGKYENGVCYYSAYLNPAEGYNTIRNNFYHISVTSIIPPGRNTPDPKDPDKELAKPTDITIEVDIVPWKWKTSEQSLS
jgi:hypothetical protein